MAKIALLGTGLLGSGMVENLLQTGHTVTVWNRTAAKTEALVALGAQAAPDPVAAVQGKERVHLVLSADDAVDAVVAALRPGLGADVFVIDHSTNLPERVAVRAKALRAEGVRYVSAPVFMSPQNARDASGMILVSAPADEESALRAILEPMTGKVFWCGARPDLAAFHKIAGNGLLLGLVGLMGDLLAMGQALSIDAALVLSLFDQWKPGAAIGLFGQRVAQAGPGPASFELAMARKDVGLMLQTAAGKGLSMLPAVAAAMDRALAEGRGQQDFAVFARLDRGDA